MGGCCAGTVITALVMIVVIIGGGVFVANMSFAELGIDEYEFSEGMTLASMGLSDVKLIDVFKIMKSIATGVEEGDVVTHPYDEDDIASAEDLFEGSNIYDPVSGEFNFEDLGEEGYILFDSPAPITIKDVELAALLDAIMVSTLEEQAGEESEGDGGSDNPMGDLEVSVRQVLLEINNDGSGAVMTTIMRFDISQFADQLSEVVPAPLNSIVSIGDYLYIVNSVPISADSEGKLILDSENATLTINDIPQELIAPFLQILNSTFEEQGDELSGGLVGEDEEENDEPTSIQDALSTVVSEVMDRIGKIGIADTNLGNSGFREVPVAEGGGGSITFIPYTEAPTE